jgi:DNA-binding transcriptional regulator YdaS (Cro superfamily)
MLRETRETLDKAIRELGGYAAAGRIFGKTRQAMYQWVKNRVPVEEVAKVERVTGIPREVLRPDIFNMNDVHHHPGGSPRQP